MATTTLPGGVFTTGLQLKDGRASNQESAWQSPVSLGSRLCVCLTDVIKNTVVDNLGKNSVRILIVAG